MTSALAKLAQQLLATDSGPSLLPFLEAAEAEHARLESERNVLAARVTEIGAKLTDCATSVTGVADLVAQTMREFPPALPRVITPDPILVEGDKLPPLGINLGGEIAP